MILTFFSNFIVRIQYIIHIIYKICVKRCLCYWEGFQSTVGYWQFSFGELKLHVDFCTAGVGGSAHNPHVVQGSTIK